MAVKKAPAPKSATPKAAPAAAAEPSVLMVHGVEATVGDIKSGGTVKKPLVAMIPLKAVSVVKGFNPRGHLHAGEIEELANNIKANGLLNNLVVRPIPGKEGHFALVSGEKRYRAITQLGWESVQVSIRTDLADDDAKALAIAISENSDDLRTGLNPIELGRSLNDLQTKEKWTVQRIANETGLHPQRVRRCLNLMDAPAQVQKMVEEKKLSLISALEIAKLDESTRKAMAAELQQRFTEAGDKTVDLSAAEVRRMAKSHASGSATNDGKSANKKSGAQRDAALTAWKGQRVKQQDIINLCYHLSQATAEEVKASPIEFAEARGSLAFALYDRGDLNHYILPDANSEEAKDVRTRKLFESLIQSEAKKHPEFAKKDAEASGDAGTDEDAAGEEDLQPGDAGDADEGSEDTAPAPKAKKTSKIKKGASAKG